MKNIGIIGAGASGLIAGITASRNGNRVTIFEKGKVIARKISASGNGQCNITNKNLLLEHYHSNNNDIVNNIIKNFNFDKTIEFFKTIGVNIRIKEDGRCYPFSFQASSVVDALTFEIDRLGVIVLLENEATDIKFNKNSITVVTNEKSHNFDSVIISTGGCASPKIGGTSSGYKILENLGHSIIPPYPSIVPINIIDKQIHRLEGIKWDCVLSVIINNRIVCSSSGELLFTKYGISGPASLDISRSVNDLVLSGGSPEISIDFFPDICSVELLTLIKNCLIPGKKTKYSLCGVTKKRIPEIILKYAGIDSEILSENINIIQLEKICNLLKNLTIKPGCPRTFDDAVAAAGGVDINQINPDNMESKIIKNLFITGEVLNVDGDCGGFNLQFAWSTGGLAGMSQ